MQKSSITRNDDWGFSFNNQIIMARQDINVNAVHGELNTTDNLTSKVIYEFNMLESQKGMDNDQFCYAEILVPPNFEGSYKDENGIHVNIPYITEFKELKICFRIDNKIEQEEFVLNKTNNQIWFPVYAENKRTIKISEYRQINENCNFNLLMNEEGYLTLFSGHETDLLIKASLAQNEAFLLKAFAGGLYQYPTTGVGLIDYLHGNFENAGLAQKLQSEFISDKMIIEDASMDSYTGNLYLNVKEKDG